MDFKQTRNRQFRWFCQQIPCHNQIHMWNVVRTRCFLSLLIDTEVFKGPRFASNKILDVKTHFKATETFQYTHFSSCHPFSVKKERHYVCYERTQLKRNPGVPKLKEILMKNWSLITNKLTQTLQESFRIVAYSIVMLTGRTNCSKTFWSELRSLPTLKNASKLWFIATYRHFLSVAS